MKENHTCAIVCYGNERLLFKLGDIVEQMLNSGVKRFLVISNHPYNSWALATCLLLCNQYKNINIVIENIKHISEFTSGCVYTREIHEGKKTKESEYVCNLSLDRIYEIIINEADVVIFDKSEESANAIEYAKKQNKPFVTFQ